MAPAQVNNSARQNMADMRAQWNDASWFLYGAGSKTVAATYASATSVTFTGADATAYWHIGRRAKAVGAGTGTIYGRVLSSSYGGGATTVNFTWDSGTLSNETLTVYAGTIPLTGTPVPYGAATVLASPTGDATYAFTRSQKTTGIAQSTTSDILRLLDASGTLIGNTFAQGLVYINVVDEALATNNSSFIWTFLNQGDGVTTSEAVQLDAKVRGTTLVSGFSIASDGASGAGKFQMTTAASGKTVTVRITFIGQVK